jgi:hypothetical protein
MLLMHMLVDAGTYSPLGNVHIIPAPIAATIDTLLKKPAVAMVGAEVPQATAERVFEVGRPLSCSGIKL